MDDRIKQVMAEAFEIPASEIDEDSSQDTIETWDSIHHIRMIVFLEREFDITVPDEEVGKMINFKLIRLVVEKCYETQI